LKEYLNHLNIALGSCSEFHSCYFSCKQAQQISEDEYERLDPRHYKVEKMEISSLHTNEESPSRRSIIGRLIRHIPDKYFPMIRYAGLFANRWKKQYLSQCGILLIEFVANVHFVAMLGASPNIASYALRSFLKSKRVTHLYGSAMIAMKVP